jgi:hydroxyquinol 1,2-dioxygenase
MLAIDEKTTITDVALNQMAGTPNPRLRHIMAPLVRLHAFAREVGLTPEEWLDGIKFLTALQRTEAVAVREQAASGRA